MANFVSVFHYAIKMDLSMKLYYLKRNNKMELAAGAMKAAEVLKL